jgi:NAD(P)-dependent dehydrogenase (short-subunit alcohol dehydrogenase family)
LKIKGRIVVVTGGADGIGKSLCERFAREGAAKVIVLDLNADGAKTVANAIGGFAYECDVSNEAEIQRIVEDIENNVGPIALFCSNAGIGDFGGQPNDATSQPNG